MEIQCHLNLELFLWDNFIYLMVKFIMFWVGIFANIPVFAVQLEQFELYGVYALLILSIILYKCYGNLIKYNKK